MRASPSSGIWGSCSSPLCCREFAIGVEYAALRRLRRAALAIEAVLRLSGRVSVHGGDFMAFVSEVGWTTTAGEVSSTTANQRFAPWFWRILSLFLLLSGALLTPV